MRSDKHLSQNSAHRWFQLEELLDSVLADVIATDARFQLMQGEAWRQFSSSLNELENIPQVNSIDFSVGFGRLENLGLSELDLTLDIEKYQPGWIKRCWWGMVHFFARKPPKPKPARYRLTQSNKKPWNQVELKIKVKRNQWGKWELKTDEDISDQGAAQES